MLSAIGGFSTVGDLYYASDDADVNAASAGAKSEGPFSSQKISPKNFHLPFKHMYEELNIIK